YGFVAFLFWMGIFRKNLRSIIPALVVLMLYGSFFQGVLPNQEGISWESHLLGAIAGLITAYLLKNQWEAEEILEKRQQEAIQHRNSLETKTYFLPRNVFNPEQDQDSQKSD
ncbi:MAG: rhomboid family intramembrane serine protease, partial [Bacteroidota bacterium]